MTDLSIDRSPDAATIRAPGSRELPREASRAAARYAAVEALGPGIGVALLMSCLLWGALRAASAYHRTLGVAGALAVTLAVYASFAMRYYAARVRTQAAPLQQETTIEVSPQRIAIRASGPYGLIDSTYTRTQIKDIKVIYAVQFDGPRDGPRDGVALFLQTGELIQLLPGRSPESLKEAVHTIRTLMQITPIDAV